MKKLPTFSLILLMLFLQIQCKDNRASISIGIGFVFGDICIHEKPSLASECIQKITAGNEVELLKLKVGDSSGKSMQWLEIRFEKKVGFISQDEERTKNTFAAILPSEETKMVVTASALRLRKFPSLISEVIQSLPRQTRVTKLGRSPERFRVEDKYDAWYRVKTKEGIIGFCYGGFLEYPSSKDVDTDAEDFVPNEIQITGFVELTKDNPTLWMKPEEEPVTNEYLKSYAGDKFIEVESFPNFLKSGRRIQISRKVTINNKNYFFVEREFSYYGGNYMDDLGRLQGWVSEDDAQFYDHSLFEKTVKEYNDPSNMALIQYLHKLSEQNLEDVSTLKVSMVFSKESTKESLWDVSYDLLDNHFNEIYRKHLLVLQNKSGFFVQLDGYNQSESLDLDNDGIPEWKSYSSGRADSSVSYYSLSSAKFEPFLRIEQNDYDQSCNITINNKTTLSRAETTNESENAVCDFKLDGNKIKLQIDKKSYNYVYESGKLTKQK